MIAYKNELLIAVSLFISTGLTGCIGPVTKPDFISSSFDASQIDTIYIMPSIAFTSIIQKSVLDDWIFKGSQAHFKIKKYNCVWLKDRSLVYGLKRSDVRDANPEVLKNIGPPEARWLLFFILYESYSTTPYSYGSILGGLPEREGSLPEFELSAYLFDKKQGERIWLNSKNLGNLSMSVGNTSIVIGTAIIMNGFPYKNR